MRALDFVNSMLARGEFFALCTIPRMAKPSDPVRASIDYLQHSAIRVIGRYRKNNDAIRLPRDLAITDAQRRVQLTRIRLHERWTRAASIDHADNPPQCASAL